MSIMILQYDEAFIVTDRQIKIIQVTGWDGLQQFYMRSRSHFTLDFSHTIEIWCSSAFAGLFFTAIRSIQVFAHAMTTQQLCHVRSKCLALIKSKSGYISLEVWWEQNKNSAIFLFWRKKCRQNRSQSHIFRSFFMAYGQIPNIRHTLIGNKFVDHSDVVGASPVGAAPTTPSFST